MLLALAEGIESAPWAKVTAQATFYHATDRRRDGANFNAMLKGVFDGIVDAGIVADDDHKHWTTLPPAFAQDKKNPRVEVTITRVE
jgi:Holliday junction resolvase RusA-like endonuclease